MVGETGYGAQTKSGCFEGCFNINNWRHPYENIKCCVSNSFSKYGWGCRVLYISASIPILWIGACLNNQWVSGDYFQALLREKSRNEDEFEATRLLFTSFFFLFIVGILAFSGMYFGADFFAGKMKDPHLAVLFRVISIIFIILPFNSVFRGYFQGNGDMLPTAVSQVGEQLIRVTTILVLAALFMHEGYSLYIVGGGAAFGSITGGIVSGVILATFLVSEKGIVVFQS